MVWSIKHYSLQVRPMRSPLFGRTPTLHPWLAADTCFVIVIMTQIVYTIMPFTYEEKCFVKIYQTICKVPIAWAWSRLITVYMRGSAAEHVSRSISNLDDLKDRVCTYLLGESWPKIIDKSIDHWLTNWRLWFNWMVDKLNSCFDYLVHFLPCSYVAYIF